MLVLVFPRMLVPVADMHADNRAAVGADIGVEFLDALGEVYGVWVCEVEESFVAGAEEGEGFLLGEGGVEGGAEGVFEGCGGDEDVAGVVGAGEAVAFWGRTAGGGGWGAEVGGIFAVRPVGSGLADGLVIGVMGKAYHLRSSMKKARCSFRASPYAIQSPMRIFPSPGSFDSRT